MTSRAAATATAVARRVDPPARTFTVVLGGDILTENLVLDRGAAAGLATGRALRLRPDVRTGARHRRTGRPGHLPHGTADRVARPATGLLGYVAVRRQPAAGCRTRWRSRCGAPGSTAAAPRRTTATTSASTASTRRSPRSMPRAQPCGHGLAIRPVGRRPGAGERRDGRAPRIHPLLEHRSSSRPVATGVRRDTRTGSGRHRCGAGRRRRRW